MFKTVVYLRSPYFADYLYNAVVFPKWKNEFEANGCNLNLRSIKNQFQYRVISRKFESGRIIYGSEILNHIVHELSNGNGFNHILSEHTLAEYSDGWKCAVSSLRFSAQKTIERIISSVFSPSLSPTILTTICSIII